MHFAIRFAAKILHQDFHFLNSISFTFIFSFFPLFRLDGADGKTRVDRDEKKEDFFLF